MRQIITLTTDFGTQDGFVGAMKGRILTAVPDAAIEDITHDIAPQNILQAALTLPRFITEFHLNSIHIVVVDPTVGSDRRILAANTSNGWVIAPDNGVLTNIIVADTPIYALKDTTPFWRMA